MPSTFPFSINARTKEDIQGCLQTLSIAHPSIPENALAICLENCSKLYASLASGQNSAQHPFCLTHSLKLEAAIGLKERYIFNGL
jgi:hypothetical protein